MHILDVLLQVGTAFFQCIKVFRAEIGTRHSAIVFQRPNGGDQNNTAWRQAAETAFDIEEFFSTEIGTESCLGDGVIGKFERQLGSPQGVASVGNVGERTAVHNDRCVFKRLNQVGLERVLEQNCHSAVCL